MRIESVLAILRCPTHDLTCIHDAVSGVRRVRQITKEYLFLAGMGFSCLSHSGIVSTLVIGIQAV